MKTNKNGVKLLAAVMVLAMFAAAIVVVPDVDAADDPSVYIDVPYSEAISNETLGNSLEIEDGVITGTVKQLKSGSDVNKAITATWIEAGSGTDYEYAIVVALPVGEKYVTFTSVDGVKSVLGDSDGVVVLIYINSSDVLETFTYAVTDDKQTEMPKNGTIDLTFDLKTMVDVTSESEMEAAIADDDVDVISITKDFTVAVDALGKNTAAIYIDRSVEIWGNGKTVTATGTPLTTETVNMGLVFAVEAAADGDSSVSIIIKDLNIDAASKVKHAISFCADNKKSTTVTVNNVDATNFKGNAFSITGGEITFINCSATGATGNWGGINIEKKTTVATSATVDENTLIDVGVVYSENVASGEASIIVPNGYVSPVKVDADYASTKKYQAYIRDISVLPKYLKSFTSTVIAINADATIEQSIAVTGSLTINIATGKTLTMDIEGDEIKDADTKLMAIYAPTKVTISGGSLDIGMNNTSAVKGENTYAIKSADIELSNINVKISASPENGSAFAISGPSSGADIKLTKVNGTIEGGNRAIQVGKSTLTISDCSNLTLIGGEKAIQQKNEGGSVVISTNSNVTMKLGETFINDGTNDRYALKVNKLSVDASSTVITDGLRLYDIPAADAAGKAVVKATISNNGIIIVKGGYTQNADVKVDETGTAPLVGMKSDSVAVNAYIGVPLKLESGKIYLDDAKYNANVIAIPVSGETVDGEIVNSADQVKNALEDADSVVITGNGTVDVADIDVSAVTEGDKTVSITGTATGSLNAPAGSASVSYSIANVDEVTINDITFKDLENVTITVTASSVSISGKDIGGTITLNEDGLNIAPGTNFSGATFVGKDDIEYSLSFSTPAASKIMVKQGSIFIGGTEAYTSDIVELDTDINTDELVDLDDVTINGNGKKIIVNDLNVTGTVSLGTGVEIVVSGTLTLGTDTASAQIIGSGKVTIKEGASVVYKSGSQIACEVDVKDEVKVVSSETDFSAANLALYNKFQMDRSFDISGSITIPAGKTIDLNGKKLTISTTGTLKITDAKILSTVSTAGTVEVLGTFTINNSDVLADVEVDDEASIVIEKAKSQTITGQSVDSTAVGYGNTLVLDGVTIEYGNTVTAYGNLEIKGTTKIVYGGSLVIGTYGNAKISGTMNVAGDVVALGSVTIDGTVNVSGSKDKSASFTALAFYDEYFEGGVTVSEDGALNIAKPSGNTYTNTLYGIVVVKGSLNMNGTFTGLIVDYGTVKINGTVNTITYDNATLGEITIPSIVAIMDGVQVDVTALYGQISITDSVAINDLVDGMATSSYERTDGNMIILENVKGVSVSTAVSTAVNKTGTTKYFYADMTVSGTVSKTDKNLDADFSIILVGSTTSSVVDGVTGEYVKIGPTSTSSRFAQIYVSETLNIGTGVDMIVDGGTVVIDGNLNAVEEDSTISINEKATLTVNGLVTIGGKNNDDVSITGDGTVNAAAYTILDSVDFYRTHYYTTADAAIDMIASAEEKTVTVLGTITLSTSKTIASEQTLTISGTLKVGSKAVLEAAKGSVIENNGKVSVSGTFIIENYDADFSGTEPSADVLAKDDTKRTYTSLKGAIESGATSIILNKNVTLYSDVTIPEGVLVTTETNGVKITVSVNCTLTVQGGLELSTGCVELDEAGVGSSDNDAELVVSGYFMYIISCDDLDDIDGAHFEKKVNGKYQNFISSVEYAAANVDDSVTRVDIIGEVSASDVTFTKGKNDLLIYVSSDAVLSVKSIKLVGVSLQIVGKMSGSVIASTGLQSTDTGATTEGIIDLYNTTGIVISSKTVEAATGTTDYMCISGILNGVATVSAGTVTIDEPYLSIVDTTVIDSKLTVAEGATISVTKANLIVSESKNGKANLVIEGTAIVSGNGNYITVANKGIASASGTVEIIEKGELYVANNGTLYITGTVKVSADKGKEGEFYAYGTVVLGEKPIILGEAGASAKIDGKIELGISGYVKAYPGADLTTTKINWQDGTNESSAFSTSLVINDVTYMTVYTQKSNLTIYTLINGEEFELVGLFNGVNFDDETKDTGLYNKGSWYTDATMSPNKKINDATAVSKDLEAVYAFADAADVYGTISVGTGLNLFIDGVPVQSGFDVKLGVGTHTVRFDVLANYDGSKAVLSFNGQVISNGSTITIGAGDKTFSLTASGAVPSESEIIVTPGEPSQPEKDDGMALTDILLIVLVVLAAILVIVVAIRMMRS